MPGAKVIDRMKNNITPDPDTKFFSLSKNIATDQASQLLTFTRIKSMM